VVDAGRGGVPVGSVKLGEIFSWGGKDFGDGRKRNESFF
jgi:hypothetical protein